MASSMLKKVYRSTHCAHIKSSNHNLINWNPTRPQMRRWIPAHAIEFERITDFLFGRALPIGIHRDWISRVANCNAAFFLFLAIRTGTKGWVDPRGNKRAAAPGAYGQSHSELAAFPSLSLYIYTAVHRGMERVGRREPWNGTARCTLSETTARHI